MATDRAGVGDEAYYRRLLKITEAANAHLDLTSMLESLTEALRAVVPLDGVGVITVDRDGLVRPFSIHLVGMPRSHGETAMQTVERILASTGKSVEDSSMRKPIAGTSAQHVCDTKRPLLCRDVRQSIEFTDYDGYVKFGISSFVCVPMFIHARFIGAVYYTRMGDPALDEADAAILEEVTPPVAMAVGNALAYEEIMRLRDRLAQEVVVLREAIDTQGMFEEIVGSSPALLDVLDSVQKVAATETTVLILGETGTGKELIARAIHKQSRRSAGPLITVNCAALPATLISSELFGHERGAFTGALQRRIGRFEMAADGTIFLDEIGDLPPDVQVALLRVLQEREFERVGGTQVLYTNARVIAATHCDLHAAVVAGTFRPDLYFRLNVFPVVVPPLRDRRDDIPLLIEYFALRHGLRVGKQFECLDAGSLRRLIAYPWPGNVRELENVVERAAILSNGNRLRIDEHALRGDRGTANDSPQLAGASLRVGMRHTEKRMIEEALSATKGRVSGPNGAARRLGLPASTLERKIRNHGIDKYRYRYS